MKNKVCFFTGHYKLPEEDTEYLARRLENEMLKLLIKGVFEYRTGAFSEFDRLAALTVLKFKKYMPEVKLHLYLTNNDQADDILDNADEVYHIEESSTSDCMEERDRRLAENCDYCICYLRKKSGRTAMSHKMAKSSGIKIVLI